MKICHSLLAAVLLVALVASGQDWQDCKTDTSYSFKEVKDSVHRVTTSRMYTGWDEKLSSGPATWYPLQFSKR